MTDSGNSVYRQAYISHSVDQLTEEDIDRIDLNAQRTLKKLGVNTLTVIMGRRIVQVLEGKKSLVRRIIARIQKNPRLSLLKTFTMESSLKPFLGSHITVVRNVKEVPQDMSVTLERMLGQFQWSSQNLRITTSQVGFLKSLALFSFDRPLRSEKPKHTIDNFTTPRKVRW